MTLPRAAPHKSMLVDDLHLSSDEDNITEPHQTTWATRDSSTEQQWSHTHDRTSRASTSSSNSGSTSSSSSTSSTRSNSSSSPSRSFNDSDSNSQHSCSPSPDMHPDPGPSATTWPLTCSMEEPEQPSPTQWHLNRWLNKVRKRQASGDQEQSVDAEPLSNLDSDSIQSPGGTWRRDHSPVQRDGHSPHYSPAPSPNFNYSARSSSPDLSSNESHTASPNPCPGFQPCLQTGLYSCQSPNPNHSPMSPSQPDNRLIPKRWASPESNHRYSTSPSLSPRPYSQPKSSLSPSPRPRSKPKSSLSPSPRPRSKPKPSLSPSPRPRSKPKSSLSPSPRPRSKPKSSLSPSPRPRSKPKSSLSPSPRPHSKPKSSLNPRHKSKSKLSLSPSPRPHSKPKPTVSPSSRPRSKPNSSLSPSCRPHSKPNSSLNPRHHSKPKSSSSPSSRNHSTSKSSLSPSSRPQSKSNSSLNPRHHPKPKSSLSPSPRHHSKSKSSLSPSSRPHSKAKSIPSPRHVPQPRSSPSPQPHCQPKSGPNSRLHSKPKSSLSLSPRHQSKPKSSLSPSPRHQSKPKSSLSPSPRHQSKPKSSLSLSPIHQSKPKSSLSPSSRPHTKPTSSSSPQPHSQPKSKPSSRTKLRPSSQPKLNLKPSSAPTAKLQATPSHSQHRKPSTVIKETEVDGQKRPPVSQRKEVPSNLWIRESEEEDDRGKERKEKRRKEKEERRKEKEEKKKEKKGKKEKGKESGKMHEAEAPAVQPKLRLQTNTQRPQKPTDYERERKKKKRRKTEEASVTEPKPSPPPSPPRKPVIPPSSSDSDPEPQPISTTATKVLADSTSGQRLSTRDQQNRAGRPRRAQLKSGRPSLADSTSGQRTSSRGQQSRAGRPRTAQLNLVRPSCWAEETPVEKRGGQGRHKLYTLVPFGRSGGAPGLGHSPPAQYARARSLRSLRVRIDLTLLPGPPEATTRPSRARSSSSTSSSSSLKKARRRGGAKRLCSPQSDHKRRRKYEESDLWKDGKQSHPPRDPPLDWKGSTVRAPTETHTDTRLNRCKEDRPANKRKTLSPLSPLTDTPECLKKGEVPHPPGKARMERMEDAPVQNIQPEMLMGRQQGPLQSVCEYRGTPPPQTTSHRQGPSIRDIALQVERYMLEAKRLKHRADSMVDRFGKVLNYVDAALSFMECGKAVEEGPLGAKSPYSMYAETVELIRYALRLKKYQGSKASNEDKQLAVLCFRCLALLYWRMFRLKKDHAIKCSNTLLEYFKSTPNSFLTPPPRSTLGKDSGAPSSTNPLSSPLCSPSSSISIPQHVHQMAADHLEITNSVLYSYEYWEVADNLAKECKEFFSYLNSLMGPLTLQSSMAHIVRYTRQGLQWIRASVQLT